MANKSDTVSYRAARASMRILELENRCTGNRTRGFESHPLRQPLAHFQGLAGLLDFQSINPSMLPLPLRPREDAGILSFCRLKHTVRKASFVFDGVSSPSSSFLDELLGRLAEKLGEEAFRRKFQIVNMTDRVRRMSDVVIGQRLGHNADTGS